MENTKQYISSRAFAKYVNHVNNTNLSTRLITESVVNYLLPSEAQRLSSPRPAIRASYTTITGRSLVHLKRRQARHSDVFFEIDDLLDFARAKYIESPGIYLGLLGTDTVDDIDDCDMVDEKVEEGVAILKERIVEYGEKVSSHYSVETLPVTKLSYTIDEACELMLPFIHYRNSDYGLASFKYDLLESILAEYIDLGDGIYSAETYQAIAVKVVNQSNNPHRCMWGEYNLNRVSPSAEWIVSFPRETYVRIINQLIVF